WDRLQRGKADEREIEELLEVVNRELSGDRFSVAFARARTPSGFTMHLVPVSLLAAFWLQFGQAISENKRLRRCAACNRWFEVAPPLNRTSRHYCGEACRSRAYRNRKEQAVRMAGLGKTPQEIAEVLASTVGTVEGWLSQR